MGKLYVVPTPVGNLEDMTFRAIRILKEADLVLAEDTRTSGILLKHFEIKNAMQSHHKFNEHKTVESVVNRIKGGETVALISDAGTPGISGFSGGSRVCPQRYRSTVPAGGYCFCSGIGGFRIAQREVLL